MDIVKPWGIAPNGKVRHRLTTSRKIGRRTTRKSKCGAHLTGAVLPISAHKSIPACPKCLERG